MKTVNKSKRKPASRIVYLVFAPNTCYTKVTNRKPYNVRLVVTTRGGRTVVVGWQHKNRSLPIGESIGYFAPGEKHGVIGVYDTNNIKHLDAMVYAAQEATTEHSSFGDQNTVTHRLARRPLRVRRFSF